MIENNKYYYFCSKIRHIYMKSHLLISFCLACFNISMFILKDRFLVEKWRHNLYQIVEKFLIAEKLMRVYYYIRLIDENNNDNEITILLYQQVHSKKFKWNNTIRSKLKPNISSVA